MPTKSSVTGIAGSIRFEPLTLAGLYHAERHGKRLDKASQGRKKNDLEPLVLHGLNLLELYQEHVTDCFIPEASTKVQHGLIQFPKDLVDMTDEQALLDHGVAFAKRVFGEGSVIAARYDRDEKSQGVVDVFLAPKYRKPSKKDPVGKLAISMTKHGKDLARRLGHVTGKGKSGEKDQVTTQDVGRALQDELFTYMRDVMALEGVKRGQKKQRAGRDWKQAEELRDEELNERDARQTTRDADQDRREQEQDAREALIAKSQKTADQMLVQAAEVVISEGAKGREAGFAAGLEAGRAQIKVDEDAAKKVRADAEEKDRAAQQRLSEAGDNRRQAELVRDAARIDGHALGKSEGLAAAKTEREEKLDQREADLDALASTLKEGTEGLAARETVVAAIERGLIAIEKGEIRDTATEKDGELMLLLAPDLEKKEELIDQLSPAWDRVWSLAKQFAGMIAERGKIAQERREADKALAAVKASQEALRASEARLATDRAALEEDRLQVAGREKVVAATELGLLAIENGEIVGMKTQEDGTTTLQVSKALSADRVKREKLFEQLTPARERVLDLVKRITGLSQLKEAYVAETTKLKQQAQTFIGVREAMSDVAKAVVAKLPGVSVNIAVAKKIVEQPPHASEDLDLQVMNAWASGKGTRGINA